MPITATIAGNSVEIQKGSLSIERRIEERSVASFSVEDITGVADYVRGNPVLIYDPDATLIFGGFIDTPGRIRVGAIGSVLRHTITCMDNHYLADKRLVVKVFTNRTLEYIAEEILTDYLVVEGVHENAAGDIETGPTIAEVIFNYVPVSEAFDALAELSGFIWLIDENKHLYFRDRATNTAPWNLDSVTYRPIKGSVRLDTGNPLYRNRQYVRGGKGVTSSEQEENFTADGVVQSFTVGYPIASEPTITETVLGLADVGIKGIDTGKDYYWNKGDATVYAEVVPANGRNVEVKFYGEYPLISMAVHPTEAATRAAIDGSSGIVEEMVTEAAHESSAGINESAEAKITEYARDAEKFIYQTRDAGLSPGQLQEITYSPFGFAAHEMLIESISVTALGDEVRYDVSCITGPLMGSWSKFFSRILTRQDNSIKIGDSLLIVLLQQSETLEMTEVTAIDEDEFAVSGLVNRWLNTAPIDAGSIHNIEHERLEMTEATSETTAPTELYMWG